MNRYVARNVFELAIEFTEEELATIKRVAETRDKYKVENKERGIRDKRIVNRPDIVTTTVGLLGEFAFAKAMGIEVDTNLYLRGDNKKDFTLHEVTIEVKTGKGLLLLNDESELRSDLLVSALYDPDDYSTVILQGWITKGEFLNVCFVQNLGYGDRLCVKPQDLVAIHSLEAYCLMTKNMRWLARNGKQ